MYMIGVLSLVYLYTATTISILSSSYWSEVSLVTILALLRGLIMKLNELQFHLRKKIKRLGRRVVKNNLHVCGVDFNIAQCSVAGTH